MNSPFSDRNMITDERRFFGRNEQKSAIFNALAGNNCVSIVGERRMGRSSLLHNIEQTYRTRLPTPHRYQFAYLNLESDSISTPKGFYGQAARVLFGQSAHEVSAAQFDELLDHNRTGGKRFVLLLDNFDELQDRREQFDDDFFDGLRARANDRSLLYVLASYTSLAEIAAANGFYSSFFGQITPVDLGELTHRAAWASITRPATPALTGEQFAEIMLWTGRTYHPLKLTIAADIIWQKMPNPHYDKLQKVYKKQIDHAFGYTTRRLRRRNERSQRLKKHAQTINQATTAIGNNKLFVLLLTCLIVVIIIWFEWGTPDQIPIWLRDIIKWPTPTPLP